MTDISIHWVGCDVASQTFDAAVLTPGIHFTADAFGRLPVQTFARTPEGVAEFVQWLRVLLGTTKGPLAARVAMEATGKYSIELTAWICAVRPELSPAIANPEQTAAYIRSLGLRNKTDRLDARALAFYGAERKPVGYEPLTPVQNELREMERYRDALVQQKVAAMNRAGETFSSASVRKSQKKNIKNLENLITALDVKIQKLIAKTPELKRDYDLLVSVPGIGPVTAAVLLGELGDLKRFGRSRQVTAFAGLTPRHRESGTSVRGATHMCKRGNGRVRKALYLAAMASVRSTSILQTYYNHLVQLGKPNGVALGAIMRKLLVIMRSIIISGIPFNRSGKPCEKKAENA